MSSANETRKPTARDVAAGLPVIPGKTLRMPLEVALEWMIINDLEFVGQPSGWSGVVRRRARPAQTAENSTVEKDE